MSSPFAILIFHIVKDSHVPIYCWLNRQDFFNQCTFKPGIFGVIDKSSNQTSTEPVIPGPCAPYTK